MNNKVDQHKRLGKLENILIEMKEGNNVANAKLKRWLTDDEFESIQMRWEDQLEIRESLKEKPTEIMEYEGLIKKGIFAENKALHDQAQVHFEKALEYLEEAVESDAGLGMWLDRELDFSAKGDMSLSADGVPRVVTSRSLSNNGGGLRMGMHTKLDIKIEVVEDTIAAI